MFRPPNYLLLIVFLTACHVCIRAQSDSISSLTITEYRDDTVYWQDLIIQNFYDRKLIFELKKIGIDREDDQVQMTTNFYDLFGNLAKTIRIEEDRYECPPVSIPDQFGVTTFVPEYDYFLLDTENVISNPIIIPDSIPIESKFCGRYSSETTYYLPYTIVTNGMSYYDDGDTSHVIDSLFLDRYGDDLRKVTYVDNEKYLEYRYHYVRDEYGRIIKKRWDNLTAGKEFCSKDEYIYNGDQKLQTFHSSHFFSQKTEKRSYKSYFDENFNVVKHENYLGDSLTSTSYEFRNDDVYRSIGVNSFGDTTHFTEYIKEQAKNKGETWSYDSRSSSDYFYGVVDTIRKKEGYCIEVHRYRITKEQFTERENSMNKGNRIRYKNKKYFNKQGRLVRELKYDSDELESEFTYEHKTLN